MKYLALMILFWQQLLILLTMRLKVLVQRLLGWLTAWISAAEPCRKRSLLQCPGEVCHWERWGLKESFGLGWSSHWQVKVGFAYCVLLIVAYQQHSRFLITTARQLSPSQGCQLHSWLPRVICWWCFQKENLQQAWYCWVRRQKWKLFYWQSLILCKALFFFSFLSCFQRCPQYSIFFYIHCTQYLYFMERSCSIQVKFASHLSWSNYFQLWITSHGGTSSLMIHRKNVSCSGLRRQFHSLAQVNTGSEVLLAWKMMAQQFTLKYHAISKTYLSQRCVLQTH